MSSVDDVLKYIATNEIRWADLQFTDLKGNLHRVSVSNRKLEESTFVDGTYAANLDDVFGVNEQGDVVLLPDPDTMARLPWEPATTRFICDLLVAGKKERFLKDPRYVADRIETNLAAAGIKTALVGAEIDCYIFDTVTTDKIGRQRGSGMMMDSREAKWGPSPISNDGRGAFVSTPYDSMYSARTQICETMEDSFGMMVDAHRHGAAPTAQQTFDMTERSLKNAADAMNTLKYVTKNLATAVTASATFMPYPIEGEKGNSLSIAVSLWKSSDSNLFFEAKEDGGQLSQAGRYFIGGLLEHANSLCLFTAPTPNSYRRLAIEEPTVGWSASRHDALVQVPSSKKNSKESKRIVFTAADPSANPYLAYSLVVAAGLDGIKNKTEPGDALEGVGKKRVSKELPGSLKEAAMALENDVKFVKGLVPAELLGDFLEAKLRQHKESLRGVTAQELQKYFIV